MHHKKGYTSWLGDVKRSSSWYFHQTTQARRFYQIPKYTWCHKTSLRESVENDKLVLHKLFIQVEWGVTTRKIVFTDIRIVSIIIFSDTC